MITGGVLAARRANLARAWESSPWAPATKSLAGETFLGGVSAPVSHWVRASRRRSFPLLVRGNVPGASTSTCAGRICVRSWTRDATSSTRVDGASDVVSTSMASASSSCPAGTNPTATAHPVRTPGNDSKAASNSSGAWLAPRTTMMSL